MHHLIPRKKCSVPAANRYPTFRWNPQKLGQRHASMRRSNIWFPDFDIDKFLRESTGKSQVSEVGTFNLIYIYIYYTCYTYTYCIYIFAYIHVDTHIYIYIYLDHQFLCTMMISVDTDQWKLDTSNLGLASSLIWAWFWHTNNKVINRMASRKHFFSSLGYSQWYELPLLHGAGHDGGSLLNAKCVKNLGSTDDEGGCRPKWFMT